MWEFRSTSPEREREGEREYAPPATSHTFYFRSKSFHYLSCAIYMLAKSDVAIVSRNVKLLLGKFELLGKNRNIQSTSLKSHAEKDD